MNLQNLYTVNKEILDLLKVRSLYLRDMCGMEGESIEVFINDKRTKRRVYHSFRDGDLFIRINNYKVYESDLVGLDYDYV